MSIRNRYIAVFAVSIAILICAIAIYMVQLNATVTRNLMGSVDEICMHDVQNVEDSIDNTYERLMSSAIRLRASKPQTIEELQRTLNFEASSSRLFDGLYMLDEQGNLYSSSSAIFPSEENSYMQEFERYSGNFVVLYTEADGVLESNRESLMYGIVLDDMQIAGRTFVGLIGRGSLSSIRETLLVESFDGQGESCIVNSLGEYIVNESLANDIAGRGNFYEMIQEGTLDGELTLDELRYKLESHQSFVMNFTSAEGERLVMSFVPIEGTAWMFVMSVPTKVFEERFASFIVMTVVMLLSVLVVLIVMMAIIYAYMRRTLKANAEAEARGQFLSNMSHEIRTPLNGIIGLNHLMGQSLGDEQAMSKYNMKMDRTAKYLLSLVNNILDISKLQAGKVDLVSEPFDMRAAIENVCDMQQDHMAEKDISFEVDLSGLDYPYVIGDEVRFSQVIMNILSNAVKFTQEDGNIRLVAKQVRFSNSDVDMVHAIVVIEDDGCGMTKAFQAEIFDAFSQAKETKGASSQKGTGLGMALSQLLIQEMDGHLTVQSDLGKGSAFTVELSVPIDPSKASVMPVSKEGYPSSSSAQDMHSGDKGIGEKRSGSRMNLLVAEDNELNAEILVSILERQGHHVDLATNGQEAIGLFKDSETGFYDAILMDAQMPVMDGYEASREIRALDRKDAREITIFACTASTFVEDRKRAVDSGMDDFLAKPLDVPVMLEKLDKIASERG